MGVVLLDGALGTALEARGVDTSGRAWSARAVLERPELVAALHREYAEAGAVVHTAATFRTRPGDVGPRWREALRRAVALARGAVPPTHRVAGSLGPVEDCWHPERCPADAPARHRELALALAEAGVDLILCETFAGVAEGLAAVDAAVATGRPTWAAFTAGPSAELLRPAALADAARAAVDRGAALVCVNCVPARTIAPWVEALARAGVPFGVYANAGDPADGLGWGAASGATAYARLASTWLDAGAGLVGGCCGTGPEHTRALAALLAQRAADADRACAPSDGRVPDPAAPADASASRPGPRRGA